LARFKLIVTQPDPTKTIISTTQNPQTPAESETQAQPAGGKTGRILTRIAFAALVFVSVLLALWATAALYFDFRISWLRMPLVIAYLLMLAFVWIRRSSRWLKLGVTMGAFALVLVWWLSLRPSNNRNWQPDVATLAYADINGNRVTLHNIRNCDYRTETDFDTRYYDKSFDLDRLSSADLFMVYWGSPHIAHTMISFGFGESDYLCFSIETRKRKGQGYSAVKGLFRQFELVYVVADERDLVRLRTNYRQGEEVYLFRLKSSREQAHTLFLNYLSRLNSLRQKPEWYSAVTENCTTGIRNQRAAADRAPWDWRILFNGHGDQMLYEHGVIDTNLPLAELKEKCHINARAKAADKATDFSRQIRKGVPGIDQ